MPVIYECDGCDKQSKDSRIIKISEVDIRNHNGQGGTTYYLCDACEVRLRSQANPQSWPRPVREAPSR